MIGKAAWECNCLNPGALTFAAWYEASSAAGHPLRRLQPDYVTRCETCGQVQRLSDALAEAA